MSEQPRRQPSRRLAHQAPSPPRPLPSRIIRRRITPEPLSHNDQPHNGAPGFDGEAPDNGEMDARYRPASASEMGNSQNAPWEGLVPVVNEFSIDPSLSWNALMGTAPSSHPFGSQEVTTAMFQSWLDELPGGDTGNPSPDYSTSGQSAPSIGSSPAFVLASVAPSFNSSSLLISPGGDFENLFPDYPTSTTPSAGSSPPFLLTTVASNFNSPSLGSPHLSDQDGNPPLTDLLSSGPADISQGNQVSLGMHAERRSSHPGSTLSAPPAASGQVAQGRSSLAAMRLQIATSIPVVAALFVGVPNGQDDRRNLFLPRIRLPSISPSIPDILHALHNCEGVLCDVVHSLCSNLDQVPCRVAWSMQLVEVGGDYTSVATGYREVGLLADHLHSSSNVISNAESNPTSDATFRMHQLDRETRLYVLYITAEFPAPLVERGPQERFIPVDVSRARSGTPALTVKNSPISKSLSNVLKTGAWLDENYMQQGFELSSLSKRGFGAAYLHVRQGLIIEDVFSRSKGTAGAVVSLTIADVAAWAGIKSGTYTNNRTFAASARATFQYLRSLNAQQAPTRAPDILQRDQEFEGLLTVFFQPETLTENWRENSTAVELSAAGSKVKETKKKIELYPETTIDSYRHQPFKHIVS
ncbi:hypothetical protein DFH07DRAFT_774476 [Mycena maculata]|uniref:Uncharacterized protein n=1 Tax=Mycena maculata TaxID=230809 RepID=A0AAD7NA43_9AGAR|nr:hypothetical protein DFH07DRAFT_774476 [Mycena maculata]